MPKQTMFFGDDQPQEIDFGAIADSIVNSPEGQEPYIGAGGNVQPSGFMPNTGKKWGQRRPNWNDPDKYGHGKVWGYDPITGKPIDNSRIGATVVMPGDAQRWDRNNWKFDPATGKPVGGLPTTPGETTMPELPAPAFDFWGNVATLLGEDVMPEDIEQLKILFGQTSGWKAPTSKKVQQLFKTAAAIKALGYDDEETMGQILKSAFDLGYRQPAFSLSLFSRMLEPYGLGVGGGSSAKKSSGTDISALLGL